MKVSEVNLSFVKPQGGILAFAGVVLNDQIYIGSIAIHKKLSSDGYRITYPTRTINDKSMHVYHPIHKRLGLKIENAILAKLNDVMNKAGKDVGYNSIDA